MRTLSFFAGFLPRRRTEDFANPSVKNSCRFNKSGRKYANPSQYHFCEAAHAHRRAKPPRGGYTTDGSGEMSICSYPNSRKMIKARITTTKASIKTRTIGLDKNRFSGGFSWRCDLELRCSETGVFSV